MSQYTTGEVARLCGVSVRTVQYYDARDLLNPSALSEGGRRLYSEDDLKRLKIICFLRELDLPIDSIRKLLQEDHPENVIRLLLNEQEKALTAEISQRTEKLRRVESMRSEMKNFDRFTVESIGDIAHIMENRHKLRRVRRNMVLMGVVMDVLEVTTLLLWIQKGIWQPFAIGMLAVVAMGVWISAYYWRHAAYICPECHAVFKPGLRQAFFAPHTPNTRRLTCTHCGHFGFCVETYGKEEPTC